MIQWSGDVPKLDSQLHELALSLSTWATGVDKALVATAAIADLISPFIFDTRLRSGNSIGNPGMEVDQRAVGAVIANVNGMAIDRWSVNKVGTMVASAQQVSATAPDVLAPNSNPGFRITSKFLRVTITTAEASLGANDVLYIAQYIEGPRFRELSNGGHSLSLLVRSNATGNFGVVLKDPPTATTYFAKLANIPTANTWTLIQLSGIPAFPFPGGNFSTAAGSMAYQLYITLAAGSSQVGSVSGSWTAGNVAGVQGQGNFATTVGTTFDLAFVQHESGNSCTQFMDVPFSGPNGALEDSLRYYQKSVPYGTAFPSTPWLPIGYCPASSANVRPYVQFPKRMAKVPTITLAPLTAVTGQVYLDGSGAAVAVSSATALDSGIQAIILSSPGPATAGAVLGQWQADTGW